MGFFSWKCKVCGHSILSPYHLTPDIRWMNDATIILENGTILTGCYDGYGRIDGTEFDLDCQPAVFHLRCWKAVRSPRRYPGPSECADDQGFFYGQEEHRMPSRKIKMKVHAYLAKQ